MKKKLIAVVLCITMGAFLMTSCKPSTATKEGDEKVYTLKMTYTIAETETIAKVAQEMAERIKEKTNGRLVLQNYPNGELASDVDALELAANGSNVLTFGTPDFLGTYVADIGILDGPYLFAGPSEFKVLEKSDWFAGERKKLEAKGIKNLSIGWYFGPRHVVHRTGKQIVTPDDMKGVRLRSASSAMRVAMLEAMGATVTQMNWNEVYSALNQGVMDGCEAPLSTIYNSKLYEVCSDVALTGHIEAIWSVNISADWFNALPEEYQKILVEEVNKSADLSIEAVQNDQKAWREKLEAEGVRFTEVNKDAFAKASEAAYSKINSYTPGLHDTIKKILN